MLELRNITKIYHSKSGNDVVALNNVSVSFPDTGMVFILGKSGCGKSTLLNVIGGLDGCDNGEFIIKGKSSKDFAGSDFDAYRNTFIGFIFQEYNILDEFSVGANIALALELQGKKATNEQINAILDQVGMLEYANRKPNELSGGQKQRIAIARALVKDPEIIMADEPTGALDSNTGKQIFDTLKELSKTKLVIIVSHDRDFAEVYGDRIIEMKDGVIISDVTKHQVDATPVSSGILMMNDNLLRIEKGYQLTAKDLDLINAYLRDRETDVLLSSDARVNDSVRSAAGISSDNKSAVFKDTDKEKDVPLKQYDSKKTSFIRSRLPMKNAVKMGSSSLGHKKFRLIFTIFLSLIAFTLFGFADTMGSYDKVTATTNSIIDSGVKNASFSLGVKEETYSKGELQDTRYQDASFNVNDVSMLNTKLQMTFTPVYNGSSNINRTISLTENMKGSQYIDSSTAYTGQLSGFAAMTKEQIEGLGYQITGTMPQSKNEIAISRFIYEQFKANGYRYGNKEIDASSLTMNEGENALIGNSIRVRVGNGEYTYKITAIIDTNFEYDRYRDYIPDTSSNAVNQQGNNDDFSVMDMVMTKELQNTLQYGYHCLGYVTNEAITNMSQNMEKWYSNASRLGDEIPWSSVLKTDANDGSFYFGRIGDSSLISTIDKNRILWLNGTPKDTLAENEMLVSMEFVNNVLYYTNIDIYPQLSEYLSENYTSFNPSQGNVDLMLVPILYEKFGDPMNHIYEPSQADWASLYTELADVIFDIDLSEFENLSDEAICSAFDNIFRWKSVDKNEETSLPQITVYVYDLTNAFARLNAYNEIYAPNSTLYTSSDIISLILNRWGISEDDYNIQSDDEKLYKAYEVYAETLMNNGSISLGTKNYSDILAQVVDVVFAMNAINLDNYYIESSYWDDGNEIKKTFRNYKIVGFLPYSENTNSLLICDNFHSICVNFRDEQGYYYYKYAPHEDGIYSFAIAPMPTNEADIRKIVELGYATGDDIAFTLQNQVTNSLDFFNEFIEMGASIFIYVGLGFALFAALMMMNFISTSISYKRREIGILRAVGARSSDVFKIFFSEALIIALINYVLSVIGTIAAVIILNNAVRNEGINVTLLNFGIRQVILMLAISVFVAVISSFLPVWKIARRKPVDAIKDT